MIYPLAPNGIFRTIQGEGALLGEPMTFVRLAGCSVGCALCDTDYRVARRLSLPTIIDEVKLLTTGRGWVWVTGGEPTDHPIGPLIEALARRWRVAVATAGHRAIPGEWPVTWLSVSPHDPKKWIQLSGSELKLIPGLNGYELSAFTSGIADASFTHRFVSPCAGRDTVAECVAWVEAHPEWRMTPQAHKAWGLA